MVNGVGNRLVRANFTTKSNVGLAPKCDVGRPGFAHEKRASCFQRHSGFLHRSGRPFYKVQPVITQHACISTRFGCADPSTKTLYVYRVVL